MIRALVVDDEPWCRRDLAERLAQVPDVCVIGEACDGPDALRQLQHTPCDVVFLDVDMPGMNGLGVVQALPPDLSPFVVFITGHTSFVLDAFEMNALDFLLKPVIERRLDATLQRLRLAMHGRTQVHVQRSLHALFEHHPLPPSMPERAATDSGPDRLRFGRLTVRDGSRIVLLDPMRIHWCTADANYVRCVIDDGRTYRVRGPLRQLSRSLPGRQFARIHRGTLVNVAHVQELRRRDDGDFDTIMRDGTILRMSARFRHCLL